MAEYLQPGVYVEEFDSGIKPMSGVSTNIAGFIGMAERGQVIGKPVLITSMNEYMKHFGNYLGEEYGQHRFLSYAVEQFFINGGSECYVKRVASLKQKNATIKIKNFFTLSASSSGVWGNDLHVQFRKNNCLITRIIDLKEGNQYSVHSTYGLCIGDIIECNNDYYQIMNIFDKFIELDHEIALNSDIQLVTFDIHITWLDQHEEYKQCSLNDKSTTYVTHLLKDSLLINMNNSDHINSIDFYKELTHNYQSYTLTSGESVIPGHQDISDDMYIGQGESALKRSGIQAFLDVDVNIIAIPGITSLIVQQALISHCEQTRTCFAILDLPFLINDIDKLKQVDQQYESSYAALYHPWITIFDLLLKKNTYIPPSGSVAGIYARVDQTRGVWKAPANEVVKNVTGLSVSYNEQEQRAANLCGVNLIRSVPGMGIRIWGASTCSRELKYINTRRLLIYIEETIKTNLNWVAYEVNDALLWSKVTATVQTFLNMLWHNGALVGSSPEEAFSVNVGRQTMSEDDIDNGRLIFNVTVALTKPNEYTNMRIELDMKD